MILLKFDEITFKLSFQNTPILREFDKTLLDKFNSTSLSTKISISDISNIQKRIDNMQKDLELAKSIIPTSKSIVAGLIAREYDSIVQLKSQIIEALTKDQVWNSVKPRDLINNMMNHNRYQEDISEQDVQDIMIKLIVTRFIRHLESDSKFTIQKVAQRLLNFC